MEYGNIELLAPAGNMESLKAAVVNGANAVYLGLKDFSARAKADNFSLDELDSAVRYAHLFGVKVHVAINTLIKDRELDSALALALEASKRNVDALILQDLGLFEKLRPLTDTPIHASTQIGIHNVYAAKLAEKMGFDRVILSREATLEDIRRIKDDTDIEIETFCQGALCVAFSGNCLMSSLVSGYSGNRGKCMQLCRKKYDIDIGGLKGSGYYLSAKDICLLANLKELINSGVTSLKIEGRMRRKEYVAESTSVYRQALDALAANKVPDTESLTKRLKSVYNRGDYCSAYTCDPTEKVIYPLVQGHKGQKIGRVKSVHGSRLELDVSVGLHPGDGLKFIGKRGESGGSLITNPVNVTYEGKVQVGDGVYLTTDSQSLKKISERKRQIDLSISVRLKVDRCAEIEISTVRESVTLKTDISVQKARSAPVDIRQIADILSVGYSDVYSVKDVKVDADDGIFMAIGQLKELRRLAESAITEKLIGDFGRSVSEKRKTYVLCLT